MKPVYKIKPPGWMASKEAKKVMAALDEANGHALFVGGSVRNALLKLPVTDIDIATQWTPEQVMARLKKAGVKAIPTGIDHGTITAVINKKHFEITTLRRDVATDGRRAVVAFTKDWKDDAQRRDFTMNTLLADARGNIYDPTGQGYKDLKAGVVRFVGDPATRIAEDYLRILRFFRFYALYGRKTKPDAKALKACRDAAGKISSLSRERITQEFFKILSVDKSEDILGIIFKNNVLNEFHFSGYDESTLKNLNAFEKKYGVEVLASKLLIVAGFDLSNIEQMEKLLLFPKELKKDIQAISEVLKMQDLDADQVIRVAIYKHGSISTGQAFLIELAQGSIKKIYAPKALKIIKTWKAPKFPITGADLKKTGIKPGPEMGKMLRELEARWVEDGFISKSQFLNNLSSKNAFNLFVN